MHRPRSVLIVVTLLLTLAGSFVTLATLAQPAPNPCPEGEVYVPDQDICVPADQVPTEAPLPTEIPAGQPTIQRLLLLHYACDAGFDPQLGTGDRNVSCTGANKPAFTYTITFGGQVVTSLTLQTADGTRGRGQLDSRFAQPLLAGEMTLAVEPVAGWMSAWMFCEIDNPETGPRVEEPAIAGNAVTVTLQAGDNVVCDWFNVATGADEGTGEEGETDPGDEVVGDGALVDEPVGSDQIVDAQLGGSVNMSFLSVSCPPGTVINADLDRICTDGLTNVTYEILSDTETVARNATDGNGVLIFENVPDGLLTMVESVPAGYGKPYVLCTHYSPTNGDREYAPTIEFGTGFMASVAPGDDLNCTWFNFPAAGPDNGPTIMIQTRWCEGYENGFAAEASLAEAEASCPPFSALEEFQVSLDGQAVATDKSNEINGQVTFTKLPVSDSGGLYGIALLAHQDAQTVAVYCDKGTGDGVYEVVPSPLSAPDRIDQQLAAGETLRCSWFINYPYGPTGTVTSDPILQEVEPGLVLVARLCNPGADLTQTDMDAACPTAGNGIAFNIDAAGEPYINTTTNPEGVIDVPLPGGDATFTITPQVPAGYGLPGYLCVSIQPGGGGGGKVVRLTADAPSHELTWASQSESTCTYYFPVIADEEAATDANEEQDGEGIQGVIADPPEATGADITIAAYFCPAGTTVASDLVATCTERASGLTFDLLTTSDTVATQTSDAEGDVFFPQVAPGDYGIAETLPSGYGEPIVICYHAFANSATEEGAEDIVFGNQVRFTIFEPGESLECAWYNVPALGADSGPNIFIEARTCSPGTSISSSMTVFDAQALCQTFYV
jgi:hypothetical protein